MNYQNYQMSLDPADQPLAITDKAAVGNDIPMRQHDTLRHTRSPGRINQESYILRGSDLLLAVASSTRSIAHRANMLKMEWKGDIRSRVTDNLCSTIYIYWS